MHKSRSILFVITEDWYYLSHRRDLANFARRNGFNIYILTKINNPKIYKLDRDINIINWSFDRSSKNIFKEIKSISKLSKIIKKIKPNIVHAVGIKPIIYSGIVSKFYKNTSFLYAFAGLGSIFIDFNIKKFFLQRIISLIIKSFFRTKNSLIVFQNSYDLKTLDKKFNLKIKKKIVQGSGVDPYLFKRFARKDNKKIQVLLPSRLLYDKGIEDFIFCAIGIKKKLKNYVSFVIAGKIDIANPSSIPLEIIEKYVNQNIIIWLNDVSNMQQVYNETDIICFPSFREGNPRALLESACCELPIISYDVPGCNDIIINNHSGILIPFRDQNKMQDSLEVLIKNNKLRDSLGKNARKHVIKNFSNNIIFDQYLKLWETLL